MSGKEKRVHWKCLVWLAPIAMLLLLGNMAQGQERAEVSVRVIAASRAERGFDPSLSDIQGKLGSLFGYSSYRLIGQQSFSLGFGQAGSMMLPGGSRARGPGREFPGIRERFAPAAPVARTLEVVPVARRGDLVELQVRMEEGGRILLNTQFRIASGGTILIGGPHFGPGVLIVALSAAAP